MTTEFFLDVRDSGTGPAIIFTHGWTDNKSHGMMLLKVFRMKLDASLGAFEVMEIHFPLLQVSTHEIIRLAILN